MEFTTPTIPLMLIRMRSFFSTFDIVAKTVFTDTGRASPSSGNGRLSSPPVTVRIPRLAHASIQPRTQATDELLEKCNTNSQEEQLTQSISESSIKASTDKLEEITHHLERSLAKLRTDAKSLKRASSVEMIEAEETPAAAAHAILPEKAVVPRSLTWPSSKQEDKRHKTSVRMPPANNLLIRVPSVEIEELEETVVDVAG